MDHGYEVVQVHEVWHWKEKRKGLFAEFVNKFLKIKTEASGWPAWCVDEESKQRYLDEFKEREGIELDRDNIIPNPGLKQIAKLMLNSFWGKFGMRDNLHQTIFIHDPKQYFAIMTSRSKIVHDVEITDDSCVMVTYSMDENYIEGNASTNLAIAAFTTSHARLRLLNMLRKLDDRVLYYDTDSVIYTSKPGEWMPPQGSILGDWDNQLDDGESHITEFISLGPKTYCYTTDTGRVEMKAKSITQNGHTEDILKWNDDHAELVKAGQSLTKETFKKLLDNKEDTFQVIYPDRLKKDFKNQTIHSIVVPKTVRLVYDKRMLLDGFTTLPFGTKATV